jgi:peptidoglycan/LPS O-acetylase OafA/YrhL
LTHNSAAGAVGSIVCSAAASLATAHLLHTFVERPSVRIAKRYREGNRPPICGAAPPTDRILETPNIVGPEFS